MNWGYRIIIVFVLFIAFIVSMVVYVSLKGADLVAEDYYTQEVDYQTIIDAKQNSIHLKDQIQVTQDNDHISIEFPEFKADHPISGTVHFYHPQTAKFDLEKALTLSEKNVQVINKANLVKGNYTIKLFWNDGTKNYYVEKSCYIS